MSPNLCRFLPLSLSLLIAYPTSSTFSEQTDVGKAKGTAAVPAAEIAKTVKAIDSALRRGVGFLLSRQNADGGFGPTRNPKNPALNGSSDLALTAFSTYALSVSGIKGDDVKLARAVKFILDRRQPDGSFYDPKDPSLLEYRTSVVMLALHSLDRVKHGEAIEAAQKFLKSRQFVEEHGFTRESPYYGGFGYDLKGQPNLSVTKYVAEAFYETGLSKGDSVWERVQLFVTRNQNGPDVDDVLKRENVGTTRDGGFRYGPNFTRGRERVGTGGVKRFSSYGSMTYAGLLSFLYANVDKTDPRVTSAFRWISDHWTIDLNPGMASPQRPQRGFEGLFYYYHTMGKALSVYGEPIIFDRVGKSHDWAYELGKKLVEIQDSEGFWVNTVADRWMESVPTVATCYAVISMASCQAELASRGTEKKK